MPSISSVQVTQVDNRNVQLSAVSDSDFGISVDCGIDLTSYIFLMKIGNTDVSSYCTAQGTSIIISIPYSVVTAIGDGKKPFELLITLDNTHRLFIMSGLIDISKGLF